MNNINSRSEKKSKIKNFLIALVAFILIKELGGYALATYNKPSNQDKFIETLYEEVDKMQETLPIKGDEFTTIEGISFDGSTITYSNTISIPSKDIERDALESILEDNFKVSCRNPDMKALLDKHITYRYSYQDLEGVYIGSFDLTKDICQNL